MPLFKKKAQPVIVAASRPTAVVAAATRLRPDAYGNLRISKAAWQEEAWRQYEISGELAFAAQWLGNALSRCALVAVDVDETGKIQGPTENRLAQEVVASFMGGPTGTANAMNALGVHLTVPGDAYIVARVDDDAVFTGWEVVSTDEIRPGLNKTVTIDHGNGDRYDLPLASTLVTRIHRPHPRRSSEATSPTRHALPVLRETEQLLKYKFSIMDSRLAGNGILAIPSELTFATPEGEIQDGENPFLTLLAEAMLASIKDRGDARALVPIVVQGPGAELANIQWIMHPGTELSQQASEDIVAAIRRLALALDMPPEVLLGVSGANDWNGFLIAEEAVKLHVEPTMALICNALTEGYLQPVLDAAGLDASKFAIWFDPAELVLRPNQGADAVTIYDRGGMSMEALRRYTGFTEQDAPEGDEACLLAAIQLIKAAPGLGDLLAKSLVRLAGLDKCGVKPEDLVPVTDGTGGTNAQVNPDGTPVQPQPNSAPVSGQDENGGPAA